MIFHLIGTPTLGRAMWMIASRASSPFKNTGDGSPSLCRLADIRASPTAMVQTAGSVSRRALAVGIGAGVMSERWSRRQRDCRSTRCSRLTHLVTTQAHPGALVVSGSVSVTD